jgi:hypothetical protein
MGKGKSYLPWGMKEGNTLLIGLPRMEAKNHLCPVPASLPREINFCSNLTPIY